MKIELSKVMKVYRGTLGKCCCGCAGRYRYASKTPGAVETQISDTVVRKQVTEMNELIEASAQDVSITVDASDPSYVSIEMPALNKLLIAYFA